MVEEELIFRGCLMVVLVMGIGLAATVMIYLLI